MLFIEVGRACKASHPAFVPVEQLVSLCLVSYHSSAKGNLLNRFEGFLVKLSPYSALCAH